MKFSVNLILHPLGQIAKLRYKLVMERNPPSHRGRMELPKHDVKHMFCTAQCVVLDSDWAPAATATTN